MSGAVVEEALGPEGEGLGVEVGAGVGEPDRRGDVGAGRQGEAVGDELLGEAAAGQRHHRAQAQRLGDRRPQVVVLARLERVAQALPARAGWRSSRSKVQASAVAVVSWPASSSVISWSRSSVSLIVLAVLEARPASASRGCRRARSRSGLRAVLGDLGVEQLVDLLQLALEPGPRRRGRRSGGWRGRSAAARGEAVSVSTVGEHRRAAAPAAARRRRRRRPAGSPPASSPASAGGSGTPRRAARSRSRRRRSRRRIGS